MEKATLTVGSTVRVRIPTNPKIQCRAVVATLQDSSACVLCEQDIGQTIGNDATATRESIKFLTNITPVFQKDSFEEEDMELTVPHSELTTLLPFETSSPSLKDTNCLPVSIWKERGDQLLQLGDAAAAIPYYERGIKQSSVLQIGGSVIVKYDGHTKVADVDCYNVDEGSVDISMAENGEERTINEKQVVLCLLQPDDDRLQERILLNLARCYLQLADATSFFPAYRRPNYLRAAGLATTLAVTIARFHDSGNNDEKFMSPTHQTALVLRAQAQASLSKFPHAIQDLKCLLAVNDQHREGRKLLRELEAKQMDRQKKDKHLVKEICQWVQQSTAGSGDDKGGEDDSVPVSSSRKMTLSTAGVATKATQEDARTDYTWQPPLTLPWLLTALFILIAALLVQLVLRP